MPFGKYRPFVPLELPDRTWPGKKLSKAPRWCSVDLRDGNQALIDPMDPARKRRMFEALVKMGFKEIEVGFPSAVQPDFDFVRLLIEEDLIPDDVTIQVLDQCRPELIQRTYESIQGRRQAIVHFYNRRRSCSAGLSSASTTPASPRSPPTRPSWPQARGHGPGHGVRYAYSPEEFTGHRDRLRHRDLSAVVDVIRARCRHGHPQPAGHGRSVHASTSTATSSSTSHRNITLRDRGSCCHCTPQRPRQRGRAAELRRAGRRRPGRGHAVRQRRAHRQRRRGHARHEPLRQGIDPELDISDIDACAASPSTATACRAPRHPYVGDLVYTAFSGSHQDAIKKGMEALPRDYAVWEVPYLPIDPKHVGAATRR
jgi:2-isopropylmalate synthase